MSIVCVAPNSLGFKVEIRLLRLLAKGRSESGLLFSNKNGRPYSANELREKQLYPILTKLGISRGGLHAARTGQPARGWQTVLHQQSYRSKCAIPMPESHLGSTVTLWVMRNGKLSKNTVNGSRNTQYSESIGADRRIRADFTLILLVAAKLVGAVGIES